MSDRYVELVREIFPESNESGISDMMSPAKDISISSRVHLFSCKLDIIPRDMQNKNL
jgi:hypothetical protein